MFCARCGAINLSTVYRCDTCGASLKMQTEAPATHNSSRQFFHNSFQSAPQLPVEPQPTAPPAGTSEQSWLKPIPHSPFGEGPLPQISGYVPVVRPSGKIQAFVPDRPVLRNLFGEEPLPDPSGSLPAVRPAGKVQAFVPGRPFPYNPFGEEPLPDPSGSLPVVRPAGESRAFTTSLPFQSLPFEPTIHNSSEAEGRFLASRTDRDIADYPTQLDGFSSSAQPTEVNAFASQASPAFVPQQNFFEFLPDEPGGLGKSMGLAAPSQTRTMAISGPLNNAYAAPMSAWSANNSQMPNGASSATISYAVMPVSKLIQPLPTWLFVLSLVGCALLLAAFIFLSPDWATGAIVAGVVAIIAAILILIVFGVRLALGMQASTNHRRRSQTFCAILPVLALFLFSGVSMIQQGSLHATQARYLEGQHSWQMAINEYQAAGELSPSSVNPARTYNEWGEALSGQQQYASAVTKFSTVLSIYGGVPIQVNLAKINLVETYVAWGGYASQRRDYADATVYYDTLLRQSYCTTSCQTQVQAKDATAYYHLAEKQLTAHQYASSVSAFTALTTRFAKSSEATVVHVDYAKALWGQGQQELNTTCSNAVKAYQQLAQQFADTPQGKLAATALQQPVSVKGRFTQTVPAAPFTPTVVLVQGLFVGIQQFQFPPLIANAPTAQINSDGTFTIAQVPQGTYELVWSDDGSLHFYYAFNGNQILYTANLGPLCTYNYGNINAAIPTN
jgi:hypothetical protein